MAKILLCFRQDHEDRTPVETYSRSVLRALEEMGHEVLPVGMGHAQTNVYEMSPTVRRQYDLFIDMDCGRNKIGHHHFQKKERPLEMPSAVWFIDSHGHPDLHKKFSKWYEHVFFAVWTRRYLFDGHKSAHWLPNASDSKWFNYGRTLSVVPQVTAGFFGTKDGLDRADILKEVCDTHDWTYDIREIGRTHKNRWPRTGDNMANCKVLFNRGQKHDGPNQRVFESMLMNRPLITDRDKTDGVSRLFEEGEHYLGWESASELANQITWCLTSPDQAADMAKRAYEEVIIKHQVKHRIQEMMGVIGVT